MRIFGQHTNIFLFFLSLFVKGVSAIYIVPVENELIEMKSSVWIVICWLNWNNNNKYFTRLVNKWGLYHFELCKYTIDIILLIWLFEIPTWHCHCHCVQTLQIFDENNCHCFKTRKPKICKLKQNPSTKLSIRSFIYKSSF